MRRLRRTPLIRELVREVAVSKFDLIQPLFVEEGLSKNVPISSMPGQTRFSFSSLEKEAIDLKDRGVGSVLLFGIPKHKDDNGSNAYDPEGIVQKSIESLKGQLDDEDRKSTRLNSRSRVDLVCRLLLEKSTLITE